MIDILAFVPIFTKLGKGNWDFTTDIFLLSDMNYKIESQNSYIKKDFKSANHIKNSFYLYSNNAFKN